MEPEGLGNLSLPLRGAGAKSPFTPIAKCPQQTALHPLMLGPSLPSPTLFKVNPAVRCLRSHSEPQG